MDTLYATLRSHGLEPPVTLKPGMNRFPGAKKSNGNMAGWCHVFDDGLGAVFGDWSTNLQQTWQAKRDKEYSPAERDAFRRHVAETKVQVEADKKARQSEAAIKAAAIWNAATPAPADHPYLEKKNIEPHGARIHNGDLVIPLRIGGTIHSLQFISPNGDKKFLTSGRVAGCYFAIAKPDGPETALLVCEGYATGASIHKATGLPVAVSFTSGNLLSVAQALREKFPGVELIVCGDDDYLTDGNPGLTKAVEAARSVNGLLAIPGFGDNRPEGVTDFNDMAIHCGLEAVEASIKKAVAPDIESSGNEVKPEAVGDDTSHVIAELATLSPIEYDRQRQEVANKLNIRVSTLDMEVEAIRRANQPAPSTTNGTCITIKETEPWAEPVDGVELLNDLSATFKRYTTLPDHAPEVLALWAIFTHTIDSAYTAPILAITSPQKRCGKTTVLTILAQVVHKPLSASNITAAALFRSIEKWGPTLLVDEADTFLKDKEELRGVINAGHTRSTSFVIRTVGDDHEPMQFNVWGGKAIALIGVLPDTIADRSINVAMRRQRPDEKIEKIRIDRVALLKDLARRCARWSADNMMKLKACDPAVPPSLHDRAADNWRPLLVIAETVGGEWPELARKAAMALSGSEVQEDDSAGVMLLSDIQVIFKEDGVAHIASADLAKKLVEIEERPWPEWAHGKPITTRQIARLLKPFGVKPGVFRGGFQTHRGYVLESFNDAFSRYIPDSFVTSVTSLKDNDLEGKRSVTSPSNVTDRNSRNTLLFNNVTDVTDGKGELGGKEQTCDVEVFEI